MSDDSLDERVRIFLSNTRAASLPTPRLLVVSACLMGLPVRYDGGHKADFGLLAALGGQAFPLCPEAEAGLGVPREPFRLEGDPERPRAVTLHTRRDLTGRLVDWCEKRCEILTGMPPVGFLGKERSPSCGVRVAIHDRGGRVVGYGPGLFVRALQCRCPGLPMAEPEGLREEDGLRVFRERIAT